MKLSKKCRYALDVILDLAHYYRHSLVHSRDLARRQNIPPKFLGQILLDLKKGGFIQSKKGPKGGYSLTGLPANITLGEVIRFMDRSLFSAFPPGTAGSQVDRWPGREGFFGVLSEIERAISSVIDSIDFAEIQRREVEVLGKEDGGLLYYI